MVFPCKNLFSYEMLFDIFLNAKNGQAHYNEPKAPLSDYLFIAYLEKLWTNVFECFSKKHFNFIILLC
jgi:hypothetical protein